MHKTITCLLFLMWSSFLVGQDCKINISTAYQGQSRIAVCLDTEIHFDAETFNCTNENVDWILTNESDIQISSGYGPNFEFTFFEEGIYTLSALIDEDNHEEITVFVRGGEVPRIFCPTIVCPGESGIYTSNISYCSDIIWNVDHGDFTAYGDSVLVEWNTAELEGYLRLNASNCLGYCPAEVIAPVNILQNSSNSTGRDFVCFSDSLVGSQRFFLPLIPGLEIQNFKVLSNVLVEGREYQIDTSQINNGFFDISWRAGEMICGELNIQGVLEHPFVGCSSRISKDIVFVKEYASLEKETYCLDEEIKLDLDLSCVEDSGLGLRIVITGPKDWNVYIKDLPLQSSWKLPNSFSENNGSYSMRTQLYDLATGQLVTCPQEIDFRVRFDDLNITGESTTCQGDTVLYITDKEDTDWIIQNGTILNIIPNDSCLVHWTGTEGHLRAEYKNQLFCPEGRELDIDLIENSDYILNGPDSVCYGSSDVQVQLSGNGPLGFWDFEAVHNMDMVDIQIIGENIYLNFNSATEDYFVAFEFRPNSTFCPDIIIRDTIHVVDGLKARALVDPGPYCLGESPILTALPPYTGNFFTWTIYNSFGDKIISKTVTDNDYTPNLEGTYYFDLFNNSDLSQPFLVTLRAQLGGSCVASMDTAYFWFRDDLQVKLDASLLEDDCFELERGNGLVRLEALINGRDSGLIYTWIFPNTIIRDETQSNLNYGIWNGKYGVFVEDDIGCRSFAEVDVQCVDPSKPGFCLVDEPNPVSVSITGVKSSCGHVSATAEAYGDIDSVHYFTWIYSTPRGQFQQLDTNFSINYFIDECGPYNLTYSAAIKNYVMDCQVIYDTMWIDGHIDTLIPIDTIPKDTLGYDFCTIETDFTTVWIDLIADFSVRSMCLRSIEIENETCVSARLNIDSVVQNYYINDSLVQVNSDNVLFVPEHLGSPIRLGLEAISKHDSCYIEKLVHFDEPAPEIVPDYSGSCASGRVCFTFSAAAKTLEYNWTDSETNSGRFGRFCIQYSEGTHTVYLDALLEDNCRVFDTLEFSVSLDSLEHDMIICPISQCDDTVGYTLILDLLNGNSNRIKHVRCYFTNRNTLLGEAEYYNAIMGSSCPSGYSYQIDKSGSYIFHVEYENGCVYEVRSPFIRLEKERINPSNILPDTIQLCELSNRGVTDSIFAFDLIDVIGRSFSAQNMQMYESGDINPIPSNDTIWVKNMAGRYSFEIILFEGGDPCAVYNIDVIVNAEPETPIISQSKVECENYPDMSFTVSNLSSTEKLAWDWNGFGGAVYKTNDSTLFIENVSSGLLGLFILDTINTCESDTIFETLEYKNPLENFPGGCYNICLSDLPLDIETPNQEQFDYWEWRLYAEDGSIQVLLSGYMSIVMPLTLDPTKTGEIILYVEKSDCEYISDAFCPFYFECQNCAVEFDVENQWCLVDQELIKFELRVDNTSDDVLTLNLSSFPVGTSVRPMNSSIQPGLNTIAVDLNASGSDNVSIEASLFSPDGSEIEQCRNSVDLLIEQCSACEDIDYSIVIEEVICLNNGVEIAELSGVISYNGPLDSVLFQIENFAFGPPYLRGVIMSGQEIPFSMWMTEDELNAYKTFDYSVSFFSIPGSETEISCCFDYFIDIDCDEEYHFEIIACSDRNTLIPTCPADLCQENSSLYLVDIRTETLINNEDFEIEWVRWCESSRLIQKGSRFYFGDYFDSYESICARVVRKIDGEILWYQSYTPDCCFNDADIYCQSFGEDIFFEWMPSFGPIQYHDEYTIELQDLNGPCCESDFGSRIIRAYQGPGIFLSDFKRRWGLDDLNCFRMRVQNETCSSSGSNEEGWTNWLEYCDECLGETWERQDNGSDNQAIPMSRFNIAYSVNPVPFKDMIRVNIEPNEGWFELSLIEITGRVVNQGIYEASKEILLYTENLQTGVYYIKIEEKRTGFQAYQKLLKLGD